MPARRHTLGGLLAALCAATLFACGDGSGEGGGTFDQPDFPFTFEYPDGFEVAEAVTLEQQLGAASDAQAAIGIDEDNAIVVQLFALKTTIDRSNLDLAQREIESLLAQLGPPPALDESQVAGLPALTAEAVTVPELEDAISRLTFIFNGDQEYLINCQSTPDHRAEVDEACDQALDTFALKSG